MKALHKTAISAAAVALLSGVATTASFAADAPAPEVSPITANVTVVNDYRYRGLTQSNFKPAIQGGFDYAHESGFYIGNWNSSISWISDGYGTAPAASPAVSAPIEMDFYAGIKKELIAEGFATDIGVLQYYYPIANLPRNSSTASVAASTGRQGNGLSPNTTEAYIAQNFTFGPVTGFAKLSYALTNIFGIYNSSGSYYPDLTVNYDTGVSGLTLNAHAGYQYIANNASGYNYSYTDWKLGVTKDFGGGLSGSLAYVSTTAGKIGATYLYAAPAAGSKNQGQGGGLISLTKTF
jgi:uncharacterized protein (TIGR02001 family)